MLKLEVPEGKRVLFEFVENYDSFEMPISVLVKELFKSNVFSMEIPFSAESIKKLDVFISKIEQNTVFNKFMRQDFQILKKFLEKSFRFNMDVIHNITKNAKQILEEETGFSFGNGIDIRWVDTFPEPYEKVTNWDYMYATKEDQEKYGIDPAIYLHTKRQFPVFYEYCIIHELVHKILDQNRREKSKLVHWFEEGLADWMAIRIHYRLTQDIKKLTLMQRLYTLYSKVFPASTLAEYYEFLKLIAKLNHVSNMKEIINIYVKDPEELKWGEVYRALKYNDIDKIKILLPQRQIPLKGDEDNLIMFFTNPVEPITVGCPEFMVLKTLFNAKDKEADKIKFIQEGTLDKETLEIAIKRLQSRGYISVRNDTIKGEERILEMLEYGIIKPGYT